MPVEILEEIFCQHPRRTAGQYFPLHGSHRCGDDEGRVCTRHCWIVVSHVCRRWRAIALRCPRLWSRLDMSLNAEWMSELVARSGTVPLEVTAYLEDPLIVKSGCDRRKIEEYEDSQARALAVLLGALPRIRALHLFTEKPRLRQEMQTLLQEMPARALEILSVQGPWVTTARPNTSPDGRAVFATLLRYTHTPLLQRLLVMNCPVRLDGLISSTLKHLSIGISGGDAFMCPDVWEVLRILQNTPSLESANIFCDGCAPMEFPELHPEFYGRVVLQHLRSLHLSTTESECAELLTHLGAPRLSSLTIHVTRDAAQLSQLLPVIVELLPGLNDVRGLCIGLSDYYGDPCFYIKTTTPEPEQVTVDLSGVVSSKFAVSRVTSHICRYLPAQSLETLLLYGDELIPPFALYKVLAATHNVTSLTIEGPYAVESLSEGLTHNIDFEEDTLDFDLPPRLPRLEILTFRNVNFGPVSSDTNRALLKLQKHLWNGQAHGAGRGKLSAVHFMNCNIIDESILTGYAKVTQTGNRFYAIRKIDASEEMGWS
ncbi:uncharacterized protein B0H18DRAFT_344214 [Fomitopsis serialis]|uniref:uncharacterized protein n=1 Tax=Fomitopsis serialis TaxID=139415 RepID=UPI0020080A05|nr:uncharacterized protein B0H18DRAFT_344214 [Neoantrodia serialis]KAH9926484.1 hypothetical protein B0H18DRAFT_344214 [Neoantrodia serialis]